MSILEALRKTVEAMGEKVDDEELRHHAQFCEEIEEHAALREAGEIVKKLAASCTLLLVRGEYRSDVKGACLWLNVRVIARCKDEDASFAEEVRNGLAEILAPYLVPESLAELGQSAH